MRPGGGRILTEAPPPGLTGEFGVLEFAVAEGEAGRRVALVTIIELDGPFSRPLGAQLAVAEDGRFAGSISGGCLEAALAEEAVRALQEGRNRILRYGRGSPYIDVRLPCGGGISLHVNAAPDLEILREAVARGRRREAFAMAFEIRSERTSITLGSAPRPSIPDMFSRAFRPRLRMVLAGRGWEVVAMARLARMWDSEIVVASQEPATLDYCRGYADQLISLTTPVNAPDLPLDAHTALACLFHEHEWETALLLDALRSPAFYVGALGSRRAQEQRAVALRELGAGPDDLARLKAPIGMFPSMDPRGIALSALSDIVAVYQSEFGRA